MSGKGSKQRPGSGYADGWDRIFGKKDAPANPIMEQAKAAHALWQEQRRISPEMMHSFGKPDAREHVRDVAEALKTQPWEHEGAISASVPQAKTCQHCRHWVSDPASLAGAHCNGKPSEWTDQHSSGFGPPADFGCLLWNSK